MPDTAKEYQNTIIPMTTKNGFPVLLRGIMILYVQIDNWIKPLEVCTHVNVKCVQGKSASGQYVYTTNNGNDW